MATFESVDNLLFDLPFIVEDTSNNELVLKSKPHGHLSKKDKEKFRNKQVTVKVYVFSEDDIKELEEVKISQIIDNSKFSEFIIGLLNSVKNVILK